MHNYYTYLALGDSYTIGEAVLLKQSFPYQTVQLLRKAGHSFAAPEIVAKPGWTSAELKQGIKNYCFLPKYDFLTLLVGVNNQYRGQDIIVYKENFESLLEKSLELAGKKHSHVFVISIPDYSVTPFARTLDKRKIRKEIDEYNHLNKALSIQYKLPYIDITESTREASSKADHTAADGLHPAAKVYNKWAKKIAEAFSKQLKK